MGEDEQMRKGIHTIRGQITLPMAQPVQHQLFNGSFTKNFIVEKLDIFQSSVVNNDTTVILHYDNVLKATANADDNAQFGWATVDALAQDWEYLDPNHLIVEDLYVTALSANPGTINYIITLKRKTTTLPQTIMAEIKANQQSL